MDFTAHTTCMLSPAFDGGGVGKCLRASASAAHLTVGHVRRSCLRQSHMPKRWTVPSGRAAAIPNTFTTTPTTTAFTPFRARATSSPPPGPVCPSHHVRRSSQGPCARFGQNNPAGLLHSRDAGLVIPSIAVSYPWRTDSLMSCADCAAVWQATARWVKACTSQARHRIAGPPTCSLTITGPATSTRSARRRRIATCELMPTR